MLKFGLLRQVTLTLAKPGGRSSTVHGLMAVDEAVLGQLSDQKFLDLRGLGFLGALYAHLVSLKALDRLNAHSNAVKEEAAA